MLQPSVSSLSRPFAAAAIGCFLLSGAALAQKPKLDVIYLPTPEPVVDKMLEMAQVRGSDYLIDLGSGDGRIPIMAAKKHGARGFGVDIDPERVKEAKENAEKEGVSDKVEFRVQNLFDTKIGDATVLSLYLLTRLNLELRPRILSELKPGTRVVSHAFDMGDWTPDRHETVEGRNAYLWIVPAKVDGRWTLSQGGRSFDLDLTQKYQAVEGTATVNGRQAKLEDVRLRGDEISFILDTGEGRRQFSGRVDGNTIEPVGSAGSAAGGVERATGWRASKAS
jgi:hypothetical protein